MSLTVGAKFPVDVQVDSPTRPAKLSDMLETGPVVVAFHQLWCPFSQEAARELRSAQYQFHAAGARVVLVYRDDIRAVSKSRSAHDIPFDCLSDNHRELETAAEIEPFSRLRYRAFAPRKLIHALRTGSHLGYPHTGWRQGRSTFVVDRDTRIVYAHRSVTAADNPPLEEILDAVRTAAYKRTDASEDSTGTTAGVTDWHRPTG